MFDLFTELGKRNKFERYVAIGSWRSPQFMLLDLDYYIWDLTKRNWFGRVKPALGITFSDELPKNEKGKPLKRLNVTDLIENAASLIQYKISSKNDFPNWKDTIDGAREILLTLACWSLLEASLKTKIWQSEHSLTLCRSHSEPIDQSKHLRFFSQP